MSVRSLPPHPRPNPGPPTGVRPHNGRDPERIATLAVIPARGGSKGLPGKNLCPVGGVPLVVRAVRACAAAAEVDAVYVTTDDLAIAGAARSAGAEIVARPADLAGDQAGSESALLHALDDLEARGVWPRTMLFVQCTSPFVDPVALDEAVTLLARREADSVFSAVRNHRFLWRPGPDGVGGVNHDPAVRQRRQDRPVEYAETGAFYGLDVAGFREWRHRFFGRTAVVEVAELSAIEIDTQADLEMAEALAAVLDPVDRRLDVDVVVTDFDGVHTDDTATVDANGLESVRVSRGDGLGVERLRQAGVPLLIVSKETNPVVGARAAKLGVEVLSGVEDKAAAVAGWLDSHGVSAGRTAYVGNDLNDLAVMATVGWPIAVPGAPPEVQRRARFVLSRAGGQGAVREVCDLVLAARDRPRVVLDTPAPGAALLTR